MQVKHLGINQICNLQSVFTHDRIACSFWFDNWSILANILSPVWFQCVTDRNILGASVFWTWVYVGIASLVSPTIPRKLWDSVQRRLRLPYETLMHLALRKTALYPSSSLTLSPRSTTRRFVLLEVLCKFGVLHVTEVHQIREVKLIFRPSLPDGWPLTLVSISGHPTLELFFHYSSTATLVSGTFKASQIKNQLLYQAIVHASHIPFFRRCGPYVVASVSPFCPFFSFFMF